MTLKINILPDNRNEKNIAKETSYQTLNNTMPPQNKARKIINFEDLLVNFSKHFLGEFCLTAYLRLKSWF